jgi:peptide/nickel transport system ATP-binding protein
VGVVAETCDKVAIMYAGEIMEYGTLDQVYSDTQHPYTQGLFASIPSLDKKAGRLQPIQGMMPNPSDLPSGCVFYPRCPRVSEVCKIKRRGMSEVSKGHFVRCVLCEKSDMEKK